MANRFQKNTFIFVGELVLGKNLIETKRLSETSQWERTRASIGVKDGTNTAFLTMEYLHPLGGAKTVKLFGKDGAIDVPINETLNKNVIEKIPSYSRIVVDLEDDFENKKVYIRDVYALRNLEFKEELTAEDKAKIAEHKRNITELAKKRVELVHIKDVMSIIENGAETLKGKRVVVRGNVKVNYYNGKSNLQYIPTQIELARDDEENKLELNLDFIFDKDLQDDQEKEKKLILNGYISERSKGRDNIYPQTLVLDYSKLDMDNPQHKGMLELMKNIYKAKDKKSVYHIPSVCKLINGREAVEFDENSLTAEQKMMIEFGMATLEDFRPRGNVYGNKIVEIRLKSPKLKDDFANGALEVMKLKELDDYLPQDDSDVSTKDVKKEEKKEEKKENKEDLFNSLFG